METNLLAVITQRSPIDNIQLSATTILLKLKASYRDAILPPPRSLPVSMWTSTLLVTLTVALLATQGSSKIIYAGINEAGGEFGVRKPGVVGTGLPGRLGFDYAFLNTSTVPIWVDEHGLNIFRVPFLLERMCPLKYGLGAQFNETHFQEYETAINAITSYGAYALLDPHNYMRYNDPSNQPSSGSIIGSTSDPKAATTAQFAAFWGAFAARFKDNEKVVFGLMNEPHDMYTSLVFKNNQAAITAIRKAGANQMILAPGNAYTGGHDWTQAKGNHDPSSKYMHQLQDPVNNTAMDIHEYLDYDFSGTHKTCNHSFAANLEPLTVWLKENNLKAFISEFGGDNSTSCETLLPAAMKYLSENDEYIGWSMWAAGPLWGATAPCCNDVARLGSLEPNSVAGGHGPSMYQTVWLKTMQSLVPTGLKRSVRLPPNLATATAVVILSKTTVPDPPILSSYAPGH
ncbi:cellulase-domain-containing protein [Clavulina sp. PMI_390]|nr:cellulase-domain-containing protein [Clavulina sp. PMI_390]